MMRIEIIPCGPLQVNCYILSAGGAKAAIAIDPAGAEPVQAYLENNQLSLSHILLTHGHFDHIGGVAALQKAYGAKVCIHRADADMLRDNRANGAEMLRAVITPSKADILLGDGDTIEAEGFSLRVLHTPGHSPGGVCYLLGEPAALFTGDTLFQMSVGRSDLMGGDEKTLFDSILNKLFVLPGEYTVYPGHMGISTLSQEREHNPYVRQYRGQQW